MTSPITLLSSPGATETQPAPAPSADQGLFNAVLLLALQAAATPAPPASLDVPTTPAPQNACDRSGEEPAATDPPPRGTEGRPRPDVTPPPADGPAAPIASVPASAADISVALGTPASTAEPAISMPAAVMTSCSEVMGEAPTSQAKAERPVQVMRPLHPPSDDPVLPAPSGGEVPRPESAAPAIPANRWARTEGERAQALAWVSADPAAPPRAPAATVNSTGQPPAEAVLIASDAPLPHQMVPVAEPVQKPANPIRLAGALDQWPLATDAGDKDDALPGVARKARPSRAESETAAAHQVRATPTVHQGGPLAPPVPVSPGRPGIVVLDDLAPGAATEVEAGAESIPVQAQADARPRLPTPIDPQSSGQGTTVSAGTREPEARFAQALAEILGDRQLTGLKVIAGWSRGEQTGSSEPHDAHESGGGESRPQSVPAARQAGSRALPSPPPATPMNVVRIGASPIRPDGDPVAIPTTHPPRPEPPADEPNLPAVRQELPAGSQPVARDLSREPIVRRPANDGPSDAGSAASLQAYDLNGPATHGEIRSPERSAGEARNLLDSTDARERPAGVADRVTLAIADADGRQTRIRVVVLGDHVRAVIQPPDGEAARHLERRMDDLQAALVRQGFVDPKVSVRVAGTEAASPWSVATPGGSSDAPPSRGTDQPPGDQRQGTGRRDQERQEQGGQHPQRRSRERDPEDRGR